MSASKPDWLFLFILGSLTIAAIFVCVCIVVHMVTR